MAIDSAAARGLSDWPEPDPAWHPIARRWFLSLRESGQSVFYEPSDIAVAQVVAEGMSRLVEAEKMSAQLFQSVLQGTTLLLSTDADRRRLRLELSRGPQVDEDEQASVTALSDYMTRAGG